MKARKALFGLLLAGGLALLASCAAGPNSVANTANEAGVLAGFWLGLWHGVIAPITFIISLFSDHVHFYEIHNNGGWYDFGFLLGLTATTGGGSSGAHRSRTRRSRKHGSAGIPAGGS